MLLCSWTGMHARQHIYSHINQAGQHNFEVLNITPHRAHSSFDTKHRHGPYLSTQKDANSSMHLTSCGDLGALGDRTQHVATTAGMRFHHQGLAKLGLAHTHTCYLHVWDADIEGFHQVGMPD